jgi:hypothetical protein
MKYKCSASLINCYINAKKWGVDNFVEMLEGDWTFNQIFEDGIQFENKIRQILQPDWLNTYNAVKSENMDKTSPECFDNYSKQLPKNGEWQRPVHLDLEVDGKIWVINGYMDLIDDENKIIYDLKTTKKHVENKYIKSVQHLIYQLANPGYDFTYIIHEWGNDEVFFEKYPFTSEEQIREKISKTILEMYSFIQTSDKLKTLFNKNWVIL